MSWVMRRDEPIIITNSGILAGARTRIIYWYNSVSDVVIWRIISQHLSVLKAEIKKYWMSYKHWVYSPSHYPIEQHYCYWSNMGTLVSNCDQVRMVCPVARLIYSLLSQKTGRWYTGYWRTDTYAGVYRFEPRFLCLPSPVKTRLFMS